MELKTLIKSIIGVNNTTRLLRIVNKTKIKRKSPESYTLWQNNKVFKNKHKGERCFILGNGPSLKNVNLSMLRDECVFSVNNFSKVEGFEKAKSNYHLWIDDAFFNGREDMKYDIKEVLNNYKKIRKVNPICFVPLSGYNFIKKHQLDRILDLHYLNILGSIQDVDLSPKSIDLTNYIPAMTTVVQYAVVIALYMGFREIYLLGCDSTSVLTTINCVLEHKNEEMHAYDNDNAEKEICGLLQHWDMSEVFYDQYLLFLGYKKIYDYCNKKNVKLINCSSPTLITSIPRKNFDLIIKKKARNN